MLRDFDASHTDPTSSSSSSKCTTLKAVPAAATYQPSANHHHHHHHYYHSVRTMRQLADQREIAALLALTGMCAIFQPSGNIAAAIGPNGTTPSSGIALSGLIGGLCLTAIGITSVVTGYHHVVHSSTFAACTSTRNSRYVTGALLVLTQTAYIAYITDMWNIGRLARENAPGTFIPVAYDPSHAQVKFVGAMGILGVLAYGCAFVGAIAFMQFSLYAFQAGKPQDRNAAYYAGRMGFYSFLLLLAGLAQFLLGVMVSQAFGSGNGALERGPVAVAMFIVSIPNICIFLGMFQIINAVWGMARSKGFFVIGGNNYNNATNGDMTYQISILLGWILQIILQSMTQVGYLPGGEAAVAAPTIVAMSFGLNLMPAYLDYKTYHSPADILEDPDYYGSINKELMRVQSGQEATFDVGDPVPQQQPRRTPSGRPVEEFDV